MNLRRIHAVSALVVVAGLGLTGCGVNAQNLPLPKPGVPSDSYTLHVIFKSALNLPTSAKVKVAGADVGAVTDITTKNFQADVTVKIQKNVQLPDGTTAELRQATPLGDVFVSMNMPQRKPGDHLLQDGDTIGINQTTAGATVEQVMTAASTLINGGVLTQAANIADQLSSMVTGHGPVLSHLIVEMTGVIKSLNDRTDQLDLSLNQLDAILGTVNDRKTELASVANTLPQEVGAIGENNQAIGALLARLAVTSDALGDFSRTTGQNLDDMLSGVDKLMSGIARWGNSLGGAMDALHRVLPGLDSSTKGSSLAALLTLQYLSIGALSDPSGSRLPNGSDVTGLVVSMTEVLQHIYGRITGGHR
ncbi:MCE family protein [Skermania sp. ID1734]|uniref:MCE family protein n=1 Tax=Skermania sp. ID1734 TaxID=2597516 RepID=UPI00163D4359|nr:MCE family protein [Skermania sp. ID1734]